MIRALFIVLILALGVKVGASILNVAAHAGETRAAALKQAGAE